MLGPRCLAVGLALLLPAASSAAPRTDAEGNPLPRGALHRLGSLRFRPGQPNASVAVSPDGKTLATLEAGMVRLFDLADGRQLRAFPLPGTSTARWIHYSPDGKHLAAAADTSAPLSGPEEEEDALFLLDAGSGKVLHQVAGEGARFWFIAFSPDGKYLLTERYHATGIAPPSGESLILWDLVAGKKVREFPGGDCHALSPDGKTLASGRPIQPVVDPLTGAGRRLIQLRDLPSGRVLHSLELPAAKAIVGALGFSPDGKLLAAGLCEWADGAESPVAPIRLWDVKTGKQRGVIGDVEVLPGEVRFVDGGRALFAKFWGGAGGLWDVGTGKRRLRLEEEDPSGKSHFEWAFSPDGKVLYWGSVRGPIRRIDVATGKEERRWGEGLGYLSHLAVTPDGKTLITAADGLRFWDTATGKERFAEKGHRTSIRWVIFLENGPALATGDLGGTVRLWDPAAGKPLPFFSGKTAQVARGSAFLAKGKYLASVDRPEPWATASVREVPSGRLVRQFKFGPADVGSWSRDGLPGWSSFYSAPGTDRKRFAFRGADGDHLIWDFLSGKQLCTLPGGRSSWVTFAPDAKTLVVRSKDGLRCWRPPAGPGGRAVELLEAANGGAFGFSTTGGLLAWSEPTALHVLDLEKGKEVRLFRDLPEVLTDLAFEPDERTLVGVDLDGRVYTWDLVTGRRVRRPLPDEETFSSVTLLPLSGPVLIGASLDPGHRRIGLYEAQTGRRLAAFHCWDMFALSPDGKFLATERGDGDGSVVAVRETATGGIVGTFPTGHRGGVSDLAFSPDGLTLATGGTDTTVVLWDWPLACGLRDGPAAHRRLDAEELRRHWPALADPDARKAFTAIEALAAGGPEVTAFLRGRLNPFRKKEGDPVRELIADLASDDFAVRERATWKLKELAGAEWQPVLREALAAGTGLEVRRRVEALLELPKMRRWSGGMLRRLRAVQLLERLGTREARALLGEVAKGLPEARLTCEARAARARLAGR